MWWPLALIALSGEVGMMVALLNGMAHHESTIVVATYYISMTIFASVQGLCVFDLLPQLTWPSASGLALGVLLCVASVVWMAGMRSKRLGHGARAIGSIDRSALIDGHIYAAEEAHAGAGGAAGTCEPVGGPAGAPNVCLEPLPASPGSSPGPPGEPAHRHTVG